MIDIFNVQLIFSQLSVEVALYLAGMHPYVTRGGGKLQQGARARTPYEYGVRLAAALLPEVSVC